MKIEAVTYGRRFVACSARLSTRPLSHFSGFLRGPDGIDLGIPKLYRFSMFIDGFNVGLVTSQITAHQYPTTVWRNRMTHMLRFSLCKSFQ